MRKLLLTGVAVAALSSTAQASLVTTASLFAPQLPAGPTTTVIGLQTTDGVVVTPGGASQTPVTTGAYSITFGAGLAANQGIVQGSVPSSVHAVPVAGVIGNTPTYLTGNFGSLQTTVPATSGNFLSTGLGTITITFTTPQTSLALLWGSIDTTNSLTFNDAAGDVLTGATVQTLAAGFTSNGFQGPTGSAYVATTTNTPFTTVTLASSVISFEAAGLVASTAPITTVPEPASLALLALGLVGVACVTRRNRTRTSLA